MRAPMGAPGVLRKMPVSLGPGAFFAACCLLPVVDLIHDVLHTRLESFISVVICGGLIPRIPSQPTASESCWSEPWRRVIHLSREVY
jgi:hypothetical protein